MPTTRSPRLHSAPARRPLRDPASYPPLPKGKVTFAQFLRWGTEDTHAEWVDEKVIYMSPSTYWHSTLDTFLLALLQFYAEARQPGAKVCCPPFAMKLSKPRPSAREPDLLYIAPASLPRLRETYLDGPADLVAEIISPSSRTRDRRDKFNAYEQSGVPEYWLLDPQRKQASFYTLGADGKYVALPIDAEGRVHSLALPGLWLQVDWLWREPRPPLLQVLGEWKLLG